MIYQFGLLFTWQKQHLWQIGSNKLMRGRCEQNLRRSHTMVHSKAKPRPTIYTGQNETVIQDTVKKQDNNIIQKQINQI